MIGQIGAYEQRLRNDSRLLERLEAGGRTGSQYERVLRRWLELLSAYEYESEILDQGSEVALAACV